MNKLRKDPRQHKPKIPRKPIIIWLFLIVTALVVAQLDRKSVV